MTVIDRDRGFRALTRRLAGTARRRVTVGIHEDVGGEARGDATLAEIAAFQEFGTVHIPERSFLRATVDQGQEQIRTLQRKLGRAVVSNKQRMDPRRALELLGLRITSMIQARIRGGIDPELAQSTIDRKGSSTPLIDTGQLIQSIAFKVR
jgi:hypothetical protein